MAVITSTLVPMNKIFLPTYALKTDIGRLCGVLFGLVLAYRPNFILEIGVRNGESTKTFIEALDFIDHGHLVSIDIADCSGVAISKRWTFQQIDSARFNPKSGFDMIFVDGDHHFEAVRRDFQKFLPHLKKDGLILFHDTEPLPQNLHNCKDAFKIREILKHSSQVEAVTIPFSNGLTIARKLW